MAWMREGVCQVKGVELWASSDSEIAHQVEAWMHTSIHVADHGSIIAENRIPSPAQKLEMRMPAKTLVLSKKWGWRHVHLIHQSGSRQPAPPDGQGQLPRGHLVSSPVVPQCNS